MFSKSNTIARGLAIAVVAIVATLALASTASASTQHKTASAAGGSYYRPFPNGIDPNNAALAWQEIAGRAAWDGQYASTIASQTGATAFAAADYRPVGYSNGMPGTTNSALSGVGSIVPLADHAGSGTAKVVIVMNIKTSKTIAFMIRCGNPRLHQSVSMVPLPWHPFREDTLLRIHRTISKPISITCPSGQKVSGSLNVAFNGVVRGSTWGKVQGSLTAKLKVGLTAQIKTFAKLRCGAVPAVLPPIPAPTPNPTPTGSCNGVAISVNGNNNTVYVCSIVVTIVCSNASVTIAGPNADVVNNAVQQYEKDNNCNTTVTPPPAPPVTPPTKPTCQDHSATNYGGSLPCQYPPVVKHSTTITCTGFEEISGGGSFLVDCDVRSDNGAPIALKVNANDGNSRVSGINCLSNGGTPSCPGNGTYEFRVSGINDGSSVLYSSITAIATANGVQDTFNSDPFPVDPSGGGF